MGRARTSWITLSVFGAVIGALALFSPRETILAPSADAQDKQWKFYGSSTCAGSSCHAASKQEETRPANEYSTWTEKDRHAKAFQSLYNDLSAEWAEYLEIEDASTSKRCTACHSTDVEESLQGDKYNVEDGVSCDACHGPAEGWFDVHTKPHKYEDMLKLGMLDIRNMWKRVDVCVRCHLQIDADIVEAGHPALSFELTQSTLREPPHWYERQTWDGIRSWAVGQAVTLREALLQIKKRIERGDAPRAVEEALRLAATHVAVFRHGLEALGDPAVIKLFKEVDDYVSFVVYEAQVNGPRFVDVCARGARALDELGKKLAQQEFTADQAKAIYKAVCTDKENLDGIDDFGAEQVAGALLALYASVKQGAGPRMRGNLEETEALKKLFVRPAKLLPEDMYKEVAVTDGSGEQYYRLVFQSEEFQKRVKAVETLVD